MGDRLRVLWLTPVPFPVVTGDASMRGGGWMEGWRWALEAHSPDVELAVLSPSSLSHEPKTVGNTTYYSLPWPYASKYSQVRRRWMHQPSAQDYELGRRAYQAVCAAYRPDIVHVHGSESRLGRYSGDSEVPVLISLQGVATVIQRFMFAGVGWVEVVADLGRPHFYKGQGYLHDYLEMRSRATTEMGTLRRCKYILGNTEWDHAVASTLCPSATYYHADRAMRREFYNGQWKPVAGSDQTLYCTGSAVSFKGLEMLVEALSLLRRTGFPHLRARVAGSVEDGYSWHALRRLSKRLNVNDAVEWLGALDARDIVTELERATVFVQPSHIENESNTVIEAMLVGAPCVAARVGGIPSILRDGFDGLLYHDRDPYALVGAIRRLLVDGNLASSLAASGREAAHRRHDPASVANQLVDTYRDVVVRWREHQSAGSRRTMARPAEAKDAM